jgi:DNA-binding PadR family transcriptional regulator
MSINAIEVRVLLNVWKLAEELGADKVSKGKLTPTFSKGKKKSYEDALKALVGGAIAETKKGNSIIYRLTDAGLQMLRDGLRSPDFGFDSSVGSGVANAVLKLMRQDGGATAAPAADKIASYEEFKEVALETYKRLRYENNAGPIIPVYQMRRDIGDRVTRSQFNDWMVEMHQSRVLHMHDGGDMTLREPELGDSIWSDVLKTYYCHAELFS